MTTFTKAGKGTWGIAGTDPIVPTDPYLRYESFNGSVSSAVTISNFGGGGGTGEGSTFQYLSPGVVGQYIRLSTAATASVTGSQGISAFYGAGQAYSGYTGSGIAGQHEETWYSVRCRFPTGWQAPVGQGNWVVEWHDDTPSITELQNFGKPSVSCALGMQANGTVTTPDGPGTSPVWMCQLNGGPTNAPNFAKTVTAIPINTGIWYVLLFHFIWDVDPLVGQAQMWVSADGGANFSTIISQSRATLFQRTDHSWSYNTHGLYNYHVMANYNISHDFDEWYIGRTRASVGY